MEGLLPEAPGLQWERPEVHWSSSDRTPSQPPPGLPSEDPDLSLQNYPRRKGGLGCQPDPKEWGGGGDLRTQQLLPTSPPTKSPGACVDSTEHQGWGLAAMECAPSRLLLSLPGSLPTTALPGLGKGGRPWEGGVPHRLPLEPKCHELRPKGHSPGRLAPAC